YLGPVDAIGRVPDVAVENLSFLRELRDGLAADYPDLVVMSHRVVQGSRAPGNWLAPVDVRPIPAVARIPHIEVIMPLVHGPADSPLLIVEDGIAGGVPPLPLLGRVERRIEEGVGFVAPPLPAVGRAPHLICANARKQFLLSRIPAADEPHATVKGQSP